MDGRWVRGDVFRVPSRQGSLRSWLLDVLGAHVHPSNPPQADLRRFYV